MPNRIIKETICTSDNLDTLSNFQEVFFYRLIVSCDDFGRMDARPKILSAKLFPLKDIRVSQIEEALVALSSAELVDLYTVGGKPFLQMKGWSAHQRIRDSKAKYPGPESSDCQQFSNTCGELRRVAASCGELRPESNPIQSESQSNPNPNPNPTSNPNPGSDGEAGRLFEKLHTNLFSESVQTVLESALTTMLQSDHITVKGQRIAHSRVMDVIDRLTIDNLDYVVAEMEAYEGKRPMSQAWVISVIFNSAANMAAAQFLDEA